jgi:uncharacterized protein with ParB-like and HNH nuclease domain
MKANENRLTDFLSTSKTRFVIPIYQRNYDWQDHQCSQLFADVLAVAKDDARPSHFVGSIVYMHDGLYTSASVKELVVIDGQQRLTTITLLWLVLHHFALDAGEEELADEIKEMYLINRYAKDRKEKLWQTQENDKIYQRLLNRQSEDGEPFSRMRENYNYFRELIRDRPTFNLVQKGLNQLSFVEINLERGKDDPQRIFESLNSTGLALSQADLIRNYILMGHDRLQQETLYGRYWNEIEKNARYDAERTNLVSDFVRDYLTFKNKKIPRKSLVYDTFKMRFPDRSYEVVEALLSDLKIYSSYYGKLINPSREPDPEIRLHLEFLSGIEVNTSYPFLLQVYHDYHSGLLDKAGIVEVLELIQAFVWRRFLVGLPTNALNKIFMRLYEDVRKDDYVGSLATSLAYKKGTQRFPKDDEVKSALRERDFYNIRSKNRSYFLDRLENYQNNEKVDFYKLTVEHIFPQTPSTGWKKDISQEDFEAFQDKHLHQLGNLTLSGNNGSLGNRSFSEKKAMNVGGKEQGYTFSRLWLNRDLKNLSEWNVATFKERHNKMLRRTLQVWPYPEVAPPSASDVSDELTIFEIDDPTGFKVEYAYIEDFKIEPKSVKEFYISVLSYLFEKDPHPLLRPYVKETILLERNDKTRRANEHIGRNYSVDASNSAGVNLKRLETVLTAYDMEDAVRVKLKET